MPIVVNYQPDLALAGQAAFAGAGGIAAENVRRWEAEFGEGQRRFDLDYDYRLQQAALDDALRRDAMRQQGDIAYGGQYLDSMALQQRGDLAEMDFALGQQQLDQRAASDQMQQQRMLSAKEMEIAQKFSAQNFEQAMAAEKAAREKWSQYTPQQQQQIMQQHEQRFGIPWGGAERALAEQSEQQIQAERAKWKNTLTKPDGSMIAPEALVDVLMQMDVKDAAGVVGKLWAEDRQREQLELKREDTLRDDERAVNDINIKQTQADQKIQNDQIQFEQRLQQMERENAMRAKLQMQTEKSKAQREFQKAVREHKRDAADPVMKSTGGVGEAPRFEDFWTPEMEAQLQAVMGEGEPSGPQTIRTQAEFDKLPRGAEYIDAETGRRARKP